MLSTSIADFILCYVLEQSCIVRIYSLVYLAKHCSRNWYIVISYMHLGLVIAIIGHDLHAIARTNDRLLIL